MAGLSGEQIFHNFKNGTGTRDMQAFAEALVELKETYVARAESIKRIQSAMESGWTGDAGSAARAGAGPLIPALHESATNMDRTFDSMTRQVTAWHDAANSVEPVPPKPDKPAPFTFGFGDNLTYAAKSIQHNVAAQRNVDVMTRYEGNTQANSDFPREYRTLPSTFSDVEVKSTNPSAVSGQMTSGPDVARGSGVAGPASAGVPMSGSAAGPTPSVSGPSSGGRVGPVASAPPTGGGTTMPPTTGGTGGFVGGASGGSGGARDTSRTGTRGRNNAAAGGRTTETGKNPPRTGAGQRAGSRLHGAGGAAAASTGGGQGAAGRVAGDAARSGTLGAPRGTGTGVPGGPAAAAGEAARGVTSGAGGRGAGAAPMGAGGAGKGQGDDETEHQRASYLQENDPDEVFLGDLGKTAPPVIGE